MKYKLFFLWLFCWFLYAVKPSIAQDVALMNKNNQSVTWEQVITKYNVLSARHPECRMFDFGKDDNGKPLNVFVISSSVNFDPYAAHLQNKVVILIMNGIHPGEPDGIDASIRLATDLVENIKKIPNNVLIGIIPVYNVGGALNRSCCSRANQNGPEAYGFRGNSRYLDLNRDFIKCDSENSRAFASLFRKWNPDIFIDNHVSDGADYTYTMTLIPSQHNKLGGAVGYYMKEVMAPDLFKMMEEKGVAMAPYVNTQKYDDDPRKGIYGFNDIARFSTGYAALNNTFSFVTETHMLKPFPDRVDATIKFMECVIEFAKTHASSITAARISSMRHFETAKYLPLNFVCDTTRFDTVMFKGYESVMRTSAVTGLPQLYYDRKKAYNKPIHHYDYYTAADSVQVPVAYIIPQAWSEVISRMRNAGVMMQRLEKDTVINAAAYYIDNYTTVTEPYEGHYLHKNIKVRSEADRFQFVAGDYYIPSKQDAIRYIVQVLEPQSDDSFFAWGFFDSILQQKEWYSAYVFDGTAEKMLQQHPALKAEFEKKKADDPKFAADAFAQYYWLYKRSPNFEPGYRKYPVARVMP